MMSATPGGDVSLARAGDGAARAFAADHPGRLELEGADATITPTTAQSLSLVLHEMATNASKYGAWSHTDARCGSNGHSPPAAD